VRPARDLRSFERFEHHPIWVRRNALRGEHNASTA
jgi:hypothetical protein